ncbi:MAG: hypothetical protein ACKO38_02725 [Planctomycetota bacterium]
MAQQEQDREDLLREATALVERVELRVMGFAEPIVAGFRRSGECSVYFGADPVYQFNGAGELRRAYVDGRLVKAERGELVFLRRERSAGQSFLVREEIAADVSAARLRIAAEQLDQLRAQLAAGQFQLIGQVPIAVDVVVRLRGWLDRLPCPLRVAAAPNVAFPPPVNPAVQKPEIKE